MKFVLQMLWRKCFSYCWVSMWSRFDRGGSMRGWSRCWGVVGVSGGAQGFTWGGDNSRWSSRALTSHLPHHGVNAVFYRWASLGLFLHSSFCYLEFRHCPMIHITGSTNIAINWPKHVNPLTPWFHHGTFVGIDKKGVKCAIKTLIYKSLIATRPHPPTFGSIVPNLPVFLRLPVLAYFSFKMWLIFGMKFLILVWTWTSN